MRSSHQKYKRNLDPLFGKYLLMALPTKKYFSPGLVVMGGDSCSEGRAFESQHHIPDGYFSHQFVVKIVMFVRKDENQRNKRQG